MQAGFVKIHRSGVYSTFHAASGAMASHQWTLGDHHVRAYTMQHKLPWLNRQVQHKSRRSITEYRDQVMDSSVHFAVLFSQCFSASNLLHLDVDGLLSHCSRYTAWLQCDGDYAVVLGSGRTNRASLFAVSLPFALSSFSRSRLTLRVTTTDKLE